MLKLLSSTQYIYVPVTAPGNTDVTAFAVSIALILESVGGEPATGDYRSATWTSTDGLPEATLLIAAADYPAGEYLAFVRVVAGAEDVRMFSGRVRIGDVRV
jgi:hypothetical protein